MESLERYLDQLASSAPTPGGGSAATIVAATGAALVEMVARICSNSPKLQTYAPLAVRTAEAAHELRRRLMTARDRDERAFEGVVAAQGLPREGEGRAQARAAALEAALTRAAEAPLHACELAADVLRLANQILEIPNRNLASDVGCAAEFGYAALAASAYNVRVNHRFMRNAETIASQAGVLARYEEEGRALLARVRVGVAQLLA